MCSHGQLSEVQMLRDLDVDLGLGQGHISIHSTCSTTSTPNHLTVASRTTEIWPFQCCELSNNLQSLNSRASFPRKKVENRSQTSCSPGPILSLTNISFVLHPKMAEKTDLEMCSYGQLWEVQMLRDLDPDLGSGQGHINIHSTCRTTSMPNRVTVASRISEIWPFEFRRSLNSRDSFPRRKFKNRAQTSCSPGPTLSPPTTSFELHTKMAEEINLEKCNFRNFGSSVTLTTLDRVEVTLVRISHTPN